MLSETNETGGLRSQRQRRALDARVQGHVGACGHAERLFQASESNRAAPVSTAQRVCSPREAQHHMGTTECAHRPVLTAAQRDADIRRCVLVRSVAMLQRAGNRSPHVRIPRHENPCMRGIAATPQSDAYPGMWSDLLLACRSPPPASRQLRDPADGFDGALTHVRGWPRPLIPADWWS